MPRTLEDASRDQLAQMISNPDFADSNNPAAPKQEHSTRDLSKKYGDIQDADLLGKSGEIYGKAKNQLDTLADVIKEVNERQQIGDHGKIQAVFNGAAHNMEHVPGSPEGVTKFDLAQSLMERAFRDNGNPDFNLGKSSCIVVHTEDEFKAALANATTEHPVVIVRQVMETVDTRNFIEKVRDRQHHIKQRITNYTSEQASVQNSGIPDRESLPGLKTVTEIWKPVQAFAETPFQTQYPEKFVQKPSDEVVIVAVMNNGKNADSRTAVSFVTKHHNGRLDLDNYSDIQYSVSSLTNFQKNLDSNDPEYSSNDSKLFRGEIPIKEYKQTYKETHGTTQQESQKEHDSKILNDPEHWKSREAADELVAGIRGEYFDLLEGARKRKQEIIDQTFEALSDYEKRIKGIMEAEEFKMLLEALDSTASANVNIAAQRHAMSVLDKFGFTEDDILKLAKNKKGGKNP